MSRDAISDTDLLHNPLSVDDPAKYRNHSVGFDGNGDIIPTDYVFGPTKILSAILEVMNEVDTIVRDMVIDGGSFRYNALSYTKINPILRDSMVKNGLILVPGPYTPIFNNNICTVTCTYTLYHAPSGETIQIGGIGSGGDKYDKAASKANTNCDKYALLRLFRITTVDDDTDRTSSDTAVKDECGKYGEAITRHLSERVKAGKISKGREASLTKTVIDLVQKEDRKELLSIMDRLNLSISEDDE